MKMWEELDYVDYIKLFAYIVIVIGGVFGNVSVILTIILNRAMWNTINCYIANLAVADAMICVVCMIPHALSKLNEENYRLGPFMCKFNPFIQTTSLTSSVLTLSAISCDRFKAVFYPYQVRVTKQRSSLVLAVVWFVSICVSIPQLIVKQQYIIQYRNIKILKCVEIWPYVTHYENGTETYHMPLMVAYYSLLSLTLFFVPVVIMLIAYFLILQRLWRSKAPGEQNAANVNAQLKIKKKVNKMVFVVLVAFIICWAPFQVIVLYGIYSNGTDKGGLPWWFRRFEWFAYYIAFANSFLNPIIYGGFNKAFRQGLCVISGCRPRERKIGTLQRTGTTNSSSRSILRKSLQTMSTTLSSFGTRTYAFFTRSKIRAPESPLNMEMQCVR